MVPAVVLRIEEVEKIQETDLVGTHRCGREEENHVRTVCESRHPFDHRVCGTSGAGEMVGFVHDQYIDEVSGPRPGFLVSENPEVGYGELVFQFGFPLSMELVGGENEDRRPRDFAEVLPDQRTGFDRLAETDLVGQQVPARRVVGHSPYGRQLVGVQADRTEKQPFGTR